MQKALSVLLCLVMAVAAALPAGAAGKSYTPATAAWSGTQYAVKSDGTLWSWGHNYRGELGDGTSKPRDTPKKILDDVVSVSATSMRAMAIRSDGSLWGWGQNASGTLNLPRSVQDQLTPVKVMDNVKKVDQAPSTTMILKSDNSLWGLGLKTYKASITDDSFWTTPYKLMDDVKDMSVTSSTLLIVKNDGSLWCWGWKPGYDYNEVFQGITDYDAYQELAARYNYSAPTKIMDDVKTVDKSLDNVMVIKTNDTLWGWGLNNGGQLGDGTTKRRTKPVKIMDNVSCVSSADYKTMAVKKDGTLWYWGGAMSETANLTPVKLMDGVADVNAKSYTGPLVITKDGSLLIWSFDKNAATKVW